MNLRRGRRLRGLVFLCLALMTHLFLLTRPLPELPFSAALSPPSETPSDEQAIVVEPFDDSRPVVQNQKAPDSENSESDKKARFLGEFRQRVEKETKSPRTGRFSEGGAVARGRGGAGVTEDVPASPEGEIPTVPGGETKAPDLHDLMTLGSRPNRLPEDVAEGPGTVLNTDPVRYASFINRVADEIYDPWVQHARRAVETLYVAGAGLDSRTYITKVTVVMNRRGEVASLRILKSSGVSELDEAPKKAFWQAEPFPNPPAQMFDADGLVRFVYEFHFEWKSSGFQIVPLI